MEDPVGVFGKERRCGGEDQGEGSAGRLGTSWWFGMMLYRLAALLHGSLPAGPAEGPPCPTPQAVWT